MSELKKRSSEPRWMNPSLAELATLTDDGKPWVRYCSSHPFFDHDLNIWFATNARRASRPDPGQSGSPPDRGRDQARAAPNPSMQIQAGRRS
jgi:hypothetical protein